MGSYVLTVSDVKLGMAWSQKHVSPAEAGHTAQLTPVDPCKTNSLERRLHGTSISVADRNGKASIVEGGDEEGGTVIVCAPPGCLTVTMAVISGDS